MSHSFATAWTVGHQAPLSMGLSHQEYSSGMPFPPPGDLPNPFNLCSKPMRCMLLFAWDLFAIQRSQMIPNIINPGKRQFVLSPMIKSLYLRAPISWLCECLCVHACTQSLSYVWLFATPWTVACQASLAVGFSRQEYWSGMPFPPPGDLPDSRIEPASPAFFALAGGFFTTAPPRKPIAYLQ